MVSVFQVGLGGAQSRRPLPQHLSMERKGQALQVGLGAEDGRDPG